MRAPSVSKSSYLRNAVVPATLAAVMLLAGCALGPAPGIAPTVSACGMSAVMYCDLSPNGNTCECVRHSDFRDLMSTLSNR